MSLRSNARNSKISITRHNIVLPQGSNFTIASNIVDDAPLEIHHQHSQTPTYLYNKPTTMSNNNEESKQATTTYSLNASFSRQQAIIQSQQVKHQQAKPAVTTAPRNTHQTPHQTNNNRNNLPQSNPSTSTRQSRNKNRNHNQHRNPSPTADEHKNSDTTNNSPQVIRIPNPNHKSIQQSRLTATRTKISSRQRANGYSGNDFSLTANARFWNKTLKRCGIHRYIKSI